VSCLFGDRQPIARVSDNTNKRSLISFLQKETIKSKNKIKEVWINIDVGHRCFTSNLNKDTELLKDASEGTGFLTKVDSFGETYIRRSLDPETSCTYIYSYYISFFGELYFFTEYLNNSSDLNIYKSVKEFFMI